MEKSLFCRWRRVIPDMECKHNCKGMEFPLLTPQKLFCAGNSGWGHWGGQHKQQAVDCSEGMEDGTLRHGRHLCGDGVGLFPEAPQSPRS